MKMDKWTQQLHDKLAEREVAPPDDLWADIEAALPTTADNEKSRARFVPLRRWLVAASVTLLIAGGGYRLWNSLNPEAPASTPTSQTLQPELSQTDPIEPQTTHGDKSRESSCDQLLTGSVPVSHPIVAQASVEDSVVKTIERTESPEIPQVENAPQQSNYEDALRQIDEEIALLSSKSDRYISVNLYASNGFIHMQHSNGVRMDESLAALYDFTPYLPHNRAFTRSDSPIYLVGYEERQKHYLPIAFGLSVSYPLSSKWALSSGITYTRLHSDFTSIIRGSSISQEQTLHYLGIPVNAQYRLFHRGGLNIYLSGGAEADYNIKTHLASEGVTQHLNRDRWQFSVQGGVGLQYDILPPLGLYAEPGVKHYFDNGSRMRNYFKDKPTSFNLQVGLRLNILQNK